MAALMGERLFLGFQWVKPQLADGFFVGAFAEVVDR